MRWIIWVVEHSRRLWSCRFKMVAQTQSNPNEAWSTSIDLAHAYLCQRGLLFASTTKLNILSPTLFNCIRENRVRKQQAVIRDACAHVGPGFFSRSFPLIFRYDTLSSRYAEFVNSEILPAVQTAAARFGFQHLAFSKHPKDRGVFGCSSGGAASLSAAWFSGSFFRVIACKSRCSARARCTVQIRPPTVSSVCSVYSTVVQMVPPVEMHGKARSPRLPFSGMPHCH